MSLKAFHVFFIAISIAMAAGLGAWGVLDHRSSGSEVNLAIGSGSGAIAVGLVAYLRSFLRKWKRVSYL